MQRVQQWHWLGRGDPQRCRWTSREFVPQCSLPLEEGQGSSPQALDSYTEEDAQWVVWELG